MNMNNIDNKEMFESKCNVCGQKILVNECRNGLCKHCGWQNSELDFENPDCPYMDNFLSFNNAKKLYSQGKPLKANFEEFIEFIRTYGEVEFCYNGKRYGIFRDRDITMFSCDEETAIGTYYTYDYFRTNAAIDGMLLSDVWDADVNGVNFLQ